MPSSPVRPPVAPRPLVGLLDHLRLAAPPGADAVQVSGVTHASDQALAGDLLVALRGARTHGAHFVGQAVQRGAVAVLTDSEGAAVAAATGVPVVVADDPRALLGEAAAWVYGFPAQGIITYGVTGTNGKTTVTTLLHHVLSGLAGPAGLVGTIEARVGTRVLPSERTTPEASDLQALLAVMRAEGVRSAALEVSSHALVLGRVGGLVVDVAGFTNLSQDHLDFHHTMQRYFEAKASLFTPQHSRAGVVVVDDPWGRRLAATATVPTTTVAVHPDDPDDPAVRAADWRLLTLEPRGAGHLALVRTPDGGRLEVPAPVPGLVNVANAVLTVALAHAGGLDAAAAAAALGHAPPVRGRMEVVATSPLAVVDYAHTPDAVASALQTLRGTAPAPLVVVLGAGGDRDASKRPLMGAAAARGADLVVVTDDNPRSEDPAAIRAAVLAGARDVDAGRVVEVPDRGEAITMALHRAGEGTVLVAGKGHEQGQEVAGVVHPFDDRAVVRAALGLDQGAEP
jgi:UDP-N-acetylmuramoyl-L-alanyl-D-glutamate--2,6-diaminopimelate ligase